MLEAADHEPNLVELGAKLANAWGSIVPMDAVCPSHIP